MHTTQNARVALVVLFGCVAAAALARQGELRWRARASDLSEPAPPAALSGEGDRLRDGQALDLNRASAAELELLPGVGPKLAREIVAARTRSGGFASVEALDAVRGIGAKKLARLRPFLRVQP